MKKQLLLAGFIASVFGFGCASKDTNSDDYSMMTKDSSVITKDSSMMTKDSTVTKPMHVDSTAATMPTKDSSMKKMQTAIPDPAKKVKKVK